MSGNRISSTRVSGTGREFSALAIELLLCSSRLAWPPTWLRAFPASVAAAVLFTAVGLSVVLPVFTRNRPLGVTVAINLVAFVGYELSAVLHEPNGFDQLSDGLVHGWKQLLTFALLLVSPRTLLVDPVMLTWLCGTVAGIAVTRRWTATLPSLVLLGAFGLSYAATQRAAGAHAIALETWLGAECWLPAGPARGAELA